MAAHGEGAPLGRWDCSELEAAVPYHLGVLTAGKCLPPYRASRCSYPTALDRLSTQRLCFHTAVPGPLLPSPSLCCP